MTENNEMNEKIEEIVENEQVTEEQVTEEQVTKEQVTEEQVTEEQVTEEQVEEEQVEVIPSMEEFSDILNKSFKKIYVGDMVDCTVITVTKSELLVNMGFISDGVIPVEETFASEEHDLFSLYQEGSTLRAEVIKINDGDGNVLLSIKKAESILVWEELQAFFKEKTKFTVKVKEVVKGGVICDIKGVRAFIPASQLATRYIEDLNSFVGMSLLVIISDLNPELSKVVLSRKAVELEENAKEKTKVFSTIKKNDRFTGKVVKLMNFGAFVDIGGVQGLVHNQDLSWSRIKHPSEVVAEGATVSVYVIDVDYQNEKISLGLKDVLADPWNGTAGTLVIGNVYEGQVEKIAAYGAFVKLANGVEGLVHISELSEKRVNRPQEIVNVGDQVKVKVIEIDPKDKKIKLSMKDTEDQFNQEELDKYTSTENATTNLESVFKVFLKDIEGK